MQGNKNQTNVRLHCMESCIDLAHEHATIWTTLCTQKKKNLNTVHKMVTVYCV